MSRSAKVSWCSVIGDESIDLQHEGVVISLTLTLVLTLSHDASEFRTGVKLTSACSHGVGYSQLLTITLWRHHRRLGAGASGSHAPADGRPAPAAELAYCFLSVLSLHASDGQLALPRPVVFHTSTYTGENSYTSYWLRQAPPSTGQHSYLRSIFTLASPGSTFHGEQRQSTGEDRCFPKHVSS